MNVLRRADPLGLVPWYYREDDRAHGPTIRELLVPGTAGDGQLDSLACLNWLRRCPDGRRTCFAAVRPVPCGSTLVREDDRLHVIEPESHSSTVDVRQTGDVPDEDLLAALTESIRNALARFQRPALALSGGLDSALLLALARRLSSSTLRVYTLDANLPGYGELDAAIATARGLDVPESQIHVVHAGQEEFRDALPSTVRACETPLYNAHPISKLLLARALVSDGVDAVITGDGADQVFASVDGRDYLPLVGAIFRASGLALCAPFADAEVIALARRMGLDANKTALRRAAEGLVPSDCIARPKRPTLTPPIDICQYANHRAIARLARELMLPTPTLESDAERMTWTTLHLLVETMTISINLNRVEV